jgi:hypothetical protein
MDNMTPAGPYSHVLMTWNFGGDSRDAVQASKRSADLVVNSTHGERTLSRLLLGSVAEAVFRDPPVDVLAIWARPAA